MSIKLSSKNDKALTEDHSHLTREIYHKQHKRIVEDDKSMKRFIKMFSNQYFGLERKFFKNAKILDAGCGDTGKLLIAVNRLGANEMHGFDLGTSFIPVLEKTLKNYKVPLKNVTIKSASVLKIPYPDNYFDFVSCHGVLVHLNNIGEVKKAFSELARVTKHNGFLYTVFGNAGGLFEEKINPAIREYYHENSDFKEFVDKIAPNDFKNIFDLIEKVTYKQTGGKLGVKLISRLFDMDFCVTIQNIIQAPVRLTLKTDEKFIVSLYEKNGFNHPKRLKRFVKRSNIRKFFSPLHYQRDETISKILYGSGSLEFLGKK